MATIDQLQKQLQEEIRMKDEIVEKTSKLLQTKRQLKEDYDKVVAERNALQQKLATNEKVDVVKSLQEKIAKLEKPSATPREADGGDLAKQNELLREHNLRLEAQVKEARQAAGEKPGLLPGKPSPNDQYYVISASDAENLTKRIKKLQTELWNLEIKHQQLQESNAKQATQTRVEIKGEDAEDVEKLKDSIKHEREFSIGVIGKYKELTDAIVELKEDLKLALDQSPNDPLLNAVNKLAQKALASSESVLLSPPEYRKDAKDKEKDDGNSSPGLSRLSASSGRPSRASKSSQDKEARPVSPSPTLSPAAALKEKERETKEKRASQSAKKTDKDKDKDKERDRKSKVTTKV